MSTFLIIHIECRSKSVFSLVASSLYDVNPLLSDPVERELNFAANQASDAISVEKYGISFSVADSENKIFKRFQFNNWYFRCYDDVFAICCEQVVG